VKEKTISERENYLRAIEFRNPEWIPITFEFQPAVWARHGQELAELTHRHPLVSGAHQRGYEYASECSDPLLIEGVTFTDDWGCVWHNAQGGLLGRVVGNPLADWKAFDTFKPPDPLDQYDWDALEEATVEKRCRGLLTIAEPESFSQAGFFDRMSFLRGYENLMLDLLEEPPQLQSLIEMLLEYNMAYLRKWLTIGVDVVWHHGDIGSQTGPMISPEVFRKHLKPAYKEMFDTCRRAGAHVWYSSDGNQLALIDDYIECGISLHDPQVRPNTVNGIRDHYKGKLCALVDIDQQMLPFATAHEIEMQIKQIVEEIGTPEGGLMLFAIPSQDVPIENIEAIYVAWEKYGFHNWLP
jgi:uroporphyrinogen decarboxylase